MNHCPRCGREYNPNRGALSRTDNETKVCSDCGMDEALHGGQQSDWPLPAKVLVVVVPVEGDLTPALVGRTDLTWFQEQVGGWLEAVNTEDATLLVNEDGRAKGLAPNERLSRHAGVSLCGAGVVVGRPDKEGGLTSAPQWALAL